MTDLATKLDHVKTDAGRFGWYRTLENRFFRVLHYLGIHIHVVRTRELEETTEYPGTLTGLVYREAEPHELYEAGRDPEMGLSREFLDAAFERGDIAFAAFDGPRLVSYVWRSESAAPHDGNIWARVDPPYCYAYKSFTLPEYRGKRISPGVHLCSDNAMLRRGYKYRAGFVEISNWASLAMGKHMGSQVVGKAGYLGWFGRCISFRSRGVKAIGFEFFNRKSPDSVN